jgi:hypothetical protein
MAPHYRSLVCLERERRTQCVFSGRLAHNLLGKMFPMARYSCRIGRLVVLSISLNILKIKDFIVWHGSCIQLSKARAPMVLWRNGLTQGNKG